MNLAHFSFFSVFSTVVGIRYALKNHLLCLIKLTHSKLTEVLLLLIADVNHSISPEVLVEL